MATRPNGTRRRLALVSEAIASRLWPVPLIAVIGAVLLGIALPVLDRAVDDSLSDLVAGLVFSGGVDAARAVLSAIAGSLITATSLTFSLTVVALQLAGSQASPRVLRMFSSDPMVHATLALFLGTFAYSITVLRTVEDAEGDADAFVPRIAVTTASVLTLASVVMLTFFLAHLARQLRVETMMREVHREASRTIALMSKGTDAAARTAASVPAAPADARVAFSRSSGFLTGVDRDELVRRAAEVDVVVQELRTVGANVVEGTPFLRWWHRESGAAASAQRTDARADGEVEQRLMACFDAAYERTPTQDVGYGLRQLADIAVKALSPGINDPTTAVHVLGHLAALLGDLAEQDHAESWADDEGVVRLIAAGDRFADFLELAVAQVRRYGAGDPVVVARLYGLFDDVAWRARGGPQRAALREQVRRLDASVAAADYDDVERERFARLAREVSATIERPMTDAAPRRRA